MADDAQGEDSHVMTKAEIGTVQLQAKEHQELPVIPRSQGEGTQLSRHLDFRLLVSRTV